MILPDSDDWILRPASHSKKNAPITKYFLMCIININFDYESSHEIFLFLFPLILIVTPVEGRYGHPKGGGSRFCSFGLLEQVHLTTGKVDLSSCPGSSCVAVPLELGVLIVISYGKEVLAVPVINKANSKPCHLAKVIQFQDILI